MLDFDDEPTAVIPRETMLEARERAKPPHIAWGEGHAPVGPDRPTRDLKMPRLDTDVDGFDDVDTAVDDLSNGVPEPMEHPAAYAQTQPVLRVA